MRGARAATAILVVALTATTARADDPSPSSVPSVMDRRWAVALAYGAAAMHPRSAETRYFAYGIFQLALRFRPIAVFEVGFGVSGGGTVNYGQAGLYADLRYRLFSERPWNPFLLIGLGASTASDTFEKPEGEFRKSVRFGGGIERRFRAWAFATEIHAFAIGDNADLPDLPGPAQTQLATSTVLGSSASIFAIYYWDRGTRTRRTRGFP